MKRTIAAIALLLSLFVAAPARAADWRQEQCRTNTGSPAWTTWDVKQTIRCAVAKWPVEGGIAKAIAVASCESGSDLLDHSTDGYAGTFQQAVRYWPERHRSTVRATNWKLQSSVYNPRPNVIVSIRMAHMSGWSPTWSCA